jgi:hypothetical protein
VCDLKVMGGMGMVYDLWAALIGLFGMEFVCFGMRVLFYLKLSYALIVPLSFAETAATRASGVAVHRTSRRDLSEGEMYSTHPWRNQYNPHVFPANP